MEEHAVEEVTQPKSKKPRSEAQMEAFKRAVDKLKEKREIEREAKSRARAELDLKKVEAKAEILKERAKKPPVVVDENSTHIQPKQTVSVPPTVSGGNDMQAFMQQVEKMLDERLRPLALKVPAVSADTGVPTLRVSTIEPIQQPKAQTQSQYSYGTPPAWYDQMFAPKR